MPVIDTHFAREVAPVVGAVIKVSTAPPLRFAGEAFLCAMRSRPSSQFVVGSFVRLVPDGPVHRVVWRGKQPMPSYSDWPGEINVYRLDNDYWDCYYEYQLYPAQPWNDSTPSAQSGL